MLVTGPTGSGKSTTLAAMVDLINRERHAHILTIEDPIEFVHPHKKCLVNQREVKVHTESFSSALRAALREDPDVILVGEMRDLETISLAVSAAETGHLVFGTLHTSSAHQTIDRIIDVFPPHQQSQIRTQLSESLMGVIAQTLMARVGGGRVAALEIMTSTAAVKNLIREGKTFQLPVDHRDQHEPRDADPGPVPPETARRRQDHARNGRREGAGPAAGRQCPRRRARPHTRVLAFCAASPGCVRPR